MRNIFLLLVAALGALFVGNGTFHSFVLQKETQVFLWLIIAASVIAAADIFLRRKHFRDLPFQMAVLLSVVGIIMISRLKAALFVPQLRWLAIGVCVFVLTVCFRKKLFRMLRYQYILGILCIIVLMLPLIFGTEIGGSRNWIVLGPIEVQPSEFGKLLLIFFLASYLSEHRQMLSLPNNKFLMMRFAPIRFMAPLLAIWGMAILMFVAARDLGSALLFFGIAVAMTYMASGSKSYTAVAVIAFMLAAVLSYHLFGHVRVRFDIWLNPWSDPSGEAYQIVQSLFAIGSGGIWGTGLGHGQPGLIPEVHTDFIFSAIGEELGLLGMILIMTIYLLLFWCGIKAALRTAESSHALLAAGASVILLLQAFIIIAGVTKFLPLTGITLPYVSYGGSSMVTCYLLLGIITSIPESSIKKRHNLKQND